MIGTLHIVLAMKPLEGNFTQNALKHGVAGLNIDGARIEGSQRSDRAGMPSDGSGINNQVFGKGYIRKYNVSELGRWPANVILEDSEKVLAGFPQVKSGVAVKRNLDGHTYNKQQELGLRAKVGDDVGYCDSCSTSRFFKQVKEV